MHYAILFLAALLRFIPHPWNVTPVGAIGLFAGAHCDRRIAWAIPLVVLAIGDAITGFYSPFVMLFVYAGFACKRIDRSLAAGDEALAGSVRRRYRH